MEALRHCPHYAMVMANWFVFSCGSIKLMKRKTMHQLQKKKQKKISQLSHCHTPIFMQHFKAKVSVIAAQKSAQIFKGGKPSVKSSCDCCVCTSEHLLDSPKLQRMRTEQQQRAICFTFSPEMTVNISVYFRLWGMKQQIFFLAVALAVACNHPLSALQQKSIIFPHQRDPRADQLYLLFCTINIIITTMMEERCL